MSTETYELLAITALVALVWTIYRIVRGERGGAGQTFDFYTLTVKPLFLTHSQ